MNWIYLAVGAHLLWAIENIFDKFVLEGKVQNPYVYNVWFNFTKLSVFLLIPFIGLPFPQLSLFLWIVFASFLFFFAALLYIKTVTLEEISRINVWWVFIPIFAFLIEFFVVGKQFVLSEFGALALLISGTIIASIHIGKKTLRFSSAIGYMLGSTFLFAVYAIVFGYIVQFMSFVHAFMWVSIISATIAFISIFATKKFRTDFVKETREVKPVLAIMIFIASLIGISGLFLNNWALSLAPASLVFAMEGTQVLFVFIIAGLLSKFAPQIIKEEIDIKNSILKIISIMLIIGGILILALK